MWVLTLFVWGTPATLCSVYKLSSGLPCNDVVCCRCPCLCLHLGSATMHMAAPVETECHCCCLCCGCSYGSTSVALTASLRQSSTAQA
jgi:hypothetical protein